MGLLHLIIRLEKASLQGHKPCDFSAYCLFQARLSDKDNPKPTKLGKHLYLNLSDVQIDTLDELLDSGILQADNSGCIADAVSDETGWCVYSTSYRIICKPDIDD